VIYYVEEELEERWQEENPALYQEVMNLKEELIALYAPETV